MDIKNKVMFLVYQFLEESGYKQSLETLIKESGVDYNFLHSDGSSGQLVHIVDRVLEKERVTKNKKNLVRLHIGDGLFVKEELCCFPNLASGANILAAKLVKDVLFSGCASGILCVTKMAHPVESTSAIDNTDFLPIHKAGIVCLDVHPTNRDLIVTGSMDKSVSILDLKKSLIEPIQVFKNHKKYVVRVRWSPTGKFLASASYDKTVCVYKEGDDGWVLWKSIPFSGYVEALTFKKDLDSFIVGIRDDHRLHIYDLTAENPFTEPQYLNMNAFGDDYVSFTPMDISMSPNGELVLVSTDRGRLILFHHKSGEQVMNYYGNLNDEYSQPRCCWDPSGLYFYSTSDDHSIIVFEVATATIVHRLRGHIGRVRDVSFSVEHNILVSSSFDGSVRFWKDVEITTEG